MPKLTDEEVGQLLRETFTEKEDLLDQLPKATTSPVRRWLPPLLAAAAVLAVLAGAVSSVGTDRKQQAQSPESVKVQAGSPMATVPVSKMEDTGLPSFVLKARLSGLAIAELTKWGRPAGGWPVVKVLDAPYEAAASPYGAGAAGTPFSEREQTNIANSAGVPVSWVKSRPGGPDVCDQASGSTPYVTVGPVVIDKFGSTATIGMSMWRGCQDAQWLTYRLERIPGVQSALPWRITGTVGPVAIS